MINDMGLDNLKYGLDQWSMDDGQAMHPICGMHIQVVNMK